MDCRLEGVQNFVANLAIDALAQYPALSSVQLDDHFAIPLALIPQNSSSAIVQEFTEAAIKVSSLVENTERFSLSPASIDFALSNYAVDWIDWAKRRLFGTFYPQMYGSDISFVP
jgi:hypothetical protein